MARENTSNINHNAPEGEKSDLGGEKLDVKNHNRSAILSRSEKVEVKVMKRVTGYIFVFILQWVGFFLYLI